jgi:protocatechuate 4,5-dioxygenase beta chain
MDFMLMMGVAGEGAKADHVDTLDLFHTMEAYFTWYPTGLPQPLATSTGTSATATGEAR